MARLSLGGPSRNKALLTSATRRHEHNIYSYTQNLTPRVVVLPGWDMSDEDRYDEEQARRRTKVAVKRSRKDRTTTSPASPKKGVRS